MQRFTASLFLVLALVVCGCSQEKPQMLSAPEPLSAPQDNATAEGLAWALVEAAGWPVEPDAAVQQPEVQAHGSGGGPFCMEREVLTGDIVHYSFECPTGCGTYDKIRVHRVVREGHPHRPITTARSILLLHGDTFGFSTFIFGCLTPYLSPEQSAAVCLAMHDIDVWGIDQNWVLVPDGLADYSFAADWGMDNQVDNLQLGLAIARIVRCLTGNGCDRMHLLGYSSGAYTGYACLNEETQWPSWLQNVKGFVCLDAALKYDRSQFEQMRLNRCAMIPNLEAQIAAGNYNGGSGTTNHTIGYLAETAPNDPSPFVPTWTNLRYALYAGARLIPASYSPWYHYTAGIYTGSVPIDLRFTSIGTWLDLLQTSAPFASRPWSLDRARCICDEEDVPWDDHLGDITVPVLLLGAAGGFGETGSYTLDLLGSSDKTIVNVSLYSQEGEVRDFGHVDLATANNAAQDVWSHLLAWIEVH